MSQINDLTTNPSTDCNCTNGCNSVPAVTEGKKSVIQFLRYILQNVFTGNFFFMILQCSDGTFVRIYSEGSVYDHQTKKFIGTITGPTIFFDPIKKLFVEVLYNWQIALPPPLLSAPPPPPVFPPPPPSPQLQCVKSVPTLPQPPAKYDEFNYSFGNIDCDLYTCPELHRTTGSWKYSFYVRNGVFFTANGTMKQEGTYSSMVYVYNGENLFLQSFQVRLKEAYDRFIKDNLHRLDK